uniref:Uncharacterized protein n=1 Tax=Oryza barthii TaxID=65489 RepID=A0A0D3G9F4_9ORYZ
MRRDLEATGSATAWLSPPAATFSPGPAVWSCSGADADADRMFSSGFGGGMAGTREGSWTPERRGEERRGGGGGGEGSWFLARSLQSVGTLHVGFSSRCSPSTSLILFSARFLEIDW